MHQVVPYTHTHTRTHTHYLYSLSSLSYPMRQDYYYPLFTDEESEEQRNNLLRVMQILSSGAGINPGL